MAAALLLCSAYFKRKIKEIVCVAQFVTKASPNMKRA